MVAALLSSHNDTLINNVTSLLFSQTFGRAKDSFYSVIVAKASENISETIIQLSWLPIKIHKMMTLKFSLFIKMSEK